MKQVKSATFIHLLQVIFMYKLGCMRSSLGSVEVLTSKSASVTRYLQSRGYARDTFD